jgi:hypothetical protein
MNIENKTVIRFDDGREFSLIETEAIQLMNKLNCLFNKDKQNYHWPFYYNYPVMSSPCKKTYITKDTLFNSATKKYADTKITISTNPDEYNTSGYVTTDELYSKSEAGM